MFILATLRDTVVIIPRNFGSDLKEVIEQELNSRFANKVRAASNYPPTAAVIRCSTFCWAVYPSASHRLSTRSGCVCLCGTFSRSVRASFPTWMGRITQTVCVCVFGVDCFVLAHCMHGLFFVLFSAVPRGVFPPLNRGGPNWNGQILLEIGHTRVTQLLRWHLHTRRENASSVAFVSNYVDLCWSFFFARTPLYWEEMAVNVDRFTWSPCPSLL